MSLQLLAAVEMPDQSKSAANTTRDLVVPVPSISPDSLNQHVFDVFEANPALVGLPVVENGRPIGLINRNIFMQSLARPFLPGGLSGQELYRLHGQGPPDGGPPDIHRGSVLPGPGSR